MGDSQLNEAERRLQSRFSFGGALLVAAAVLVAASILKDAPNRTPMPPRTVGLHLRRLALDARSVAPLRLAGAWRLTADDSRFGGLSALAFDDGQLLALSDSGGLMRLAVPGPAREATVAIAELPDGPGSPVRKRDRDSEALARDPQGRGWWVAFEQYHQLWLFDRGFGSALGSIDLGRKRWRRNLGVEAMLADPGRPTLLPEPGREVVEVGHGRAASRPLRGTASRISDAARLPDGETLVLLRGFGLRGIENALGVLMPRGDGWAIERRVALDLGPLVNLEGLAVEAMPGGATRLWLVSDDNFQPPMTTELIALDVPPGRWPGNEAR